MRYSHKSLYNMSDQEFQEIRAQIKDIFDRIDPITMNNNPEYENFEVPQVPFRMHTFYKDQMWTTINPDLFAIFWLLSLDNIYVPTEM